MTGRCVLAADILDDGGAFLGDGPQPGDYWKQGGQWYAVVPNGLFANLKNHTITEHENGTITVAESILVTGHNDRWHGYLERGVWRAC